MTKPSAFGQPCWSKHQVSKVIPPGTAAQTSSESAPYFLAAHSPFHRISDSKGSGRTLTEEEVFGEIFSSARDQVQTFIKGEPGTGKSHLIRWLKLRADYASERREAGIDRFKSVFVSRGNGSLKNALSQIVSQLGREYQQHIERVRGAIDRLSEATARATLLAELALEVDARWTNERERAALPHSIRHLGQALRSEGFGRWLKRDGGIVHQAIQRLTEQSTAEERESFPSFDDKELCVPSTCLRAEDNADQVQAFGYDLQEEPETRTLTADTLNIALKDAIQGMTGLRGSDLLQIFSDIRRELGPTKSLAVFIEDVSVAGLDQDIVNAFEPRSGDGLCRMVAVLGITNNGWDRMPDNQRQRATHVFEVGGEVVTQWCNDVDEVARFTARYLNAVRLSDSEIEEVASERFLGDIPRSKCDACRYREQCHQAFESVEVASGVTVGMFPFNRRAPQALLANLGTRYKSQRGLLDRVLRPALDQSYTAFAGGDFPRPALFGVDAPPLLAWTGFENKHCGGVGWDGETKSRIRFLAQFWADATSETGLAEELQPLLEPLGFPKFSSVPPPKPGKKVGGNAEKEQPKPKPRPIEDAEAARLLRLLDAWRTGQQLKEDSKFRDLLSDFLRTSMRWEDERGTPISEPKRLMESNRFIKIEGQTTQPVAQLYFVPFERSVETYRLLLALLLFNRQGHGAWDFEHGELHKRFVTGWLRQNRARVVASMLPETPSLVQSATKFAARLLAITSVLHHRKRLPEKRVELLERVLGGGWDPGNRPTALSREMEELISDLENKRAALRDFLVKELGAGQGDAPPRDFIDPIPIFDAVEDLDRSIDLETLPSIVSQNYWKSRFVAVANLTVYGEFSERLKMERGAIKDAVAKVSGFVSEAGYDNADTPEALSMCLTEVLEVIALQRGGSRQPRAILPFPDETFEDLWQRKLVQDSQRRESWGVAFDRASALADEKGEGALLAFDPARLKELVTSLGVLERHLDLAAVHIQAEEDAGGPMGDSRKQLLDELKKLAGETQTSAEEAEEPGR